MLWRGTHNNKHIRTAFPPKRVVPDEDVYTRYLKDHPRAMNLTYKLNYNVFMDTELWGRIFETTTPSMNFMKPDSMTYGVGINQLAGPFIVNLRYAIRHNYKTPNRTIPFNRNFVDIDVVWNRWLCDHERLELKFNIGRVFDTNIARRRRNVEGVKAWVGYLTLTWHFGNGRDFRDFSPENIQFRQIRERNLPPSQLPLGGGL